MSEYIRGIIFFLIFVSFVGIILPEGKYKNYINLVLGFVVMALVFRPVSDIGGIVGNISAQLLQTSVMDGGVYEENYQAMIADTVRAQMREQLSRAMDVMGYHLISLDADINIETGELRSITLTLTSPETPSEIRIAPITILPATEASDAVSTVEASADIKKIVSDFYQLPEEHIHVIIRQ